MALLNPALAVPVAAKERTVTPLLIGEGPDLDRPLNRLSIDKDNHPKTKKMIITRPYSEVLHLFESSYYDPWHQQMKL